MSELSLPLDDTVLFDPAAPGAIEMASELIAQGGVVAIPDAQDTPHAHTSIRQLQVARTGDLQ